MAVSHDVYTSFTGTMPRRLLAAIDKRAAALGLARVAYLAHLVRLDLRSVGIEPPEPPPPKRNGPKPAKR